MLWTLLVVAVVIPLLLFQGFIFILSLSLKWKCRALRRELLNGLAASPEEQLTSDRKVIVGFFHPYCNAGGGGERVLWAAIAYLQREEPSVVCAVYTGDTDASKEDILDKVKSRFGITLNPSTLAFVYLPSRYMVDDKTWKSFTLLGQSLGSVYLAWEALDRLVPDIFVDTMGYAFTFSFIPRANTLPIGAYVHYPTISTDMLNRVRERKSGVTNADVVAKSSLRSAVKLRYYQLFSFVYSFSLSCANVIVVNGSWTKNHIDFLLRRWLTKSKKGETPIGVPVLYPPCDTVALQNLPLQNRERILLSVAQFRPEKNHAAQLRALHALYKEHPEYQAGPLAISMVMLGGCRSLEDRARVEMLKDLARELNISDSVQFVLNAPYEDLVQWFGRASIGISSMIDEHFGINVVEMVAAGLIPVAHASGGPLLDIVIPNSEGLPTGFLYQTDKDAEDFAKALSLAIALPEDQMLKMRQRARDAANRFSTREFEKGFSEFWTSLRSRL
ncbi:glycosyltransferase family 4 protein [Clavulina sp. PMI_390]|nr:glycosyltransferase family 4 protein [Clavulina sp. PMI_390]